jgi:hypothetical protein
MASDDPATAWQSAQAIGDAGERATAFRAVIAAVATDDPDIARKLIDDDRTLSAAEAEALRSVIAPQPGAGSP